MLTIGDFDKQTAQEYGDDSLDAIDSEDSVYMVPKQPVAELPKLRVHIWPRTSVDSDCPVWTWNWLTSCPEPELEPNLLGPEGLTETEYVGGKTEHDTLYSSIVEAAEAALASINDHLENELPAERRLEEEAARAEKENKDRVQQQVNDFMRD